MSKVVLFAAVLLLVAGIATAGILNPEASTCTPLMDATGGDTNPTGALPYAPLPGCYFACPQGDTETFADAGMSVEFFCIDGALAPIPDIPRSDFWLVDHPITGGPPAGSNAFPLVLCSGAAAIDADAASDVNGWAEIEDEQFKVGGCTNHLAGVVQGFLITNGGNPEDLWIEVRSVDLNADLIVGLPDLAIFAAGFFPNYDPCADYDCSGGVLLPDLARFAFHFGPPGHQCQ